MIKLKSKINWKLLVICVAIPLIIGAVSAFITMDSMEQFAALNQPPLSPPGWLFPIVWTVLYILMGVSSYLVLCADAPEKPKDLGIKVYAVQLFFNFFWSIFFFDLGLYFFSFVWLLIMWALIIVTIYLFAKSSKLAAYLMIPYLLWVTFAAYLNLGIAILN